jgi:hypothetical protein
VNCEHVHLRSRPSSHLTSISAIAPPPSYYSETFRLHTTQQAPLLVGLHNPQAHYVFALLLSTPRLLTLPADFVRVDIGVGTTKLCWGGLWGGFRGWGQWGRVDGEGPVQTGHLLARRSSCRPRGAEAAEELVGGGAVPTGSRQCHRRRARRARQLISPSATHQPSCLCCNFYVCGNMFVATCFVLRGMLCVATWSYIAESDSQNAAADQ